MQTPPTPTSPPENGLRAAQPLRIEARELELAFGVGPARQPVLRGVDLSLAPGGVTLLIGPSGTGKSVLLKLLAGLLRPDRGEVLLDGQEITGLGERELLPLRRRVGYIFQQGGLLASLTVAENVALGLIENGLMPREAALAVAVERLEEVGLAGAGDKMPGELSGGMRKRASIARALAMQPDALLYDEPTAGLDPPRARQIDNLIAEVNRRSGATTLVVTHDIETIERLQGQVRMLSEGRIIFAGSAEELLASEDPVIRDFLNR